MTVGTFLFDGIAIALVLFIGIVLVFFPYKVIQVRAELQENMFKPFRLNLEDIDNSPILSILYGKNYSKRLKSQQEHPEDHKFLLIWSRILGMMILLFTCISIWLMILAFRTGNLTIR